MNEEANPLQLHALPSPSRAIGECRVICPYFEILSFEREFSLQDVHALDMLRAHRESRREIFNVSSKDEDIDYQAF